MAHDLPAERQVADIVLPDFQGELVGFRAGEELRRGSKGVVDQAPWYTVIGDDEKSRVRASAGDGARERRRGIGLTGQKRPDIEHRDPTLTRNRARS